MKKILAIMFRFHNSRFPIILLAMVCLLMSFSPWIILVSNNAIHLTTYSTPFFLILGFTVVMLICSITLIWDQERRVRNG